MLNKLKAAFGVFQKGKVVADPAKWKARQITVTVLAGFLWSAAELARAYGLEIPVDQDSVNQLAIGVIGITNFVLTLTTSDKVGLQFKRNPDGG